MDKTALARLGWLCLALHSTRECYVWLAEEDWDGCYQYQASPGPLPGQTTVVTTRWTIGSIIPEGWCSN